MARTSAAACRMEGRTRAARRHTASAAVGLGGGRGTVVGRHGGGGGGEEEEEENMCRRWVRPQFDERIEG